jgi:RNA polymerase sigma-70 factor (ECF subfamily)
VRAATLKQVNRVNGGWKHEQTAKTGWEQWLAEFAPRLLLFARQQTAIEADAQDLVQEAVVETWQRQDNGGPPSLSTVYLTIRHRAIDLARSRGRRVRREAVLADESPPCWFDSDAEERERSHMIQNAMRQLPAIYRDVVTLKVWGGLTFAEIAAVLEISANTAASRYRYGLSELRQLTKELFA